MGLFNRKRKTETAPLQEQTTLVPGIGRMPYPAYRGREPYIFISYAHCDADKVFAEIKAYNENGYNIWYDEGISPGNEWTDEIAEALDKCALFLVFITPAAADSPNVQNEINFAIDEKKPFLAIHIEETVLRGGLKLQIGTKQAILKYKMSADEYVYKYMTAFERLGIKRKAGFDNQMSRFPEPSTASVAPAAENTLYKSESSEITTIGYFQIEHGLLKDYLGSEPNIKLPDEVQIIGHSSFGEGRRFIETVDLNRTGALLDNAFANCPNLREIRVPRSVTMIQERPFVNCPHLTVYCYRDHLPKNFEKNYGGKDIIYLDEK